MFFKKVGGGGGGIWNEGGRGTKKFGNRCTKVSKFVISTLREATFGRSPMPHNEQVEWLFVSGCECKSKWSGYL
jgi:hypothetical protein